MSPAKCRLLNAASQPIYQLFLASEESPLQRAAHFKELRITVAELLQGVEGGHEPIHRRHVLGIECNPLTEWAIAIDEFAHAGNEPAPARLIGGVRPCHVRDDGHEEDANRGSSAVCPLLTYSPRLRKKDLISVASVLPTRVGKCSAKWGAHMWCKNYVRKLCANMAMLGANFAQECCFVNDYVRRFSARVAFENPVRKNRKLLYTQLFVGLLKYREKWG